MEAIKNWAFSVCAAAICGGILNMLLPEGNAQKTYKAVFCVFFLCVLSAPLSEIKIPDFEKLAENIEIIETQNGNEFNEISAEFIKKQIIEDTSAILLQENIAEKDISVKVNISEDGSIDINKFVLTLGYSEYPDALVRRIYQKTGIEPEIILSGEN